MTAVHNEKLPCKLLMVNVRICTMNLDGIGAGKDRPYLIRKLMYLIYMTRPFLLIFADVANIIDESSVVSIPDSTGQPEISANQCDTCRLRRC